MQNTVGEEASATWNFISASGKGEVKNKLCYINMK
jgi:hypothetical protein